MPAVLEPLSRFRFDGPTLRQKREARRLTQSSLADLVGVSRQRIAQWEAAAVEALSERDLQRYLMGLNRADLVSAQANSADEETSREQLSE